MDAYVTFRLPGLALPDETKQAPRATPAQQEAEPAVSDEALIREIGEGSREAVTVLFRRYARIVRGVAYRVLRDASEAEDMVQDVFILLQRDSTQFDSSKAPARFWILQIAYRRAISRRRYLTSRKFYTRLDFDEVSRELADPQTAPGRLEDSIDRKLENGRLQRVLTTLSEDQRQTLSLFFMQGYTLDEIAAKLGQSRGNVKHHRKIRESRSGSGGFHVQQRVINGRVRRRRCRRRHPKCRKDWGVYSIPLTDVA